MAAPRAQLEEMLAATACELPTDDAARAQVREMGHALRRLIGNRRSDELRRPSGFAVFALMLMAAALLWCGTQLSISRPATAVAAETTTRTSEEALVATTVDSDDRTELTIAELARRAPSLRNGSVQAWWAGEQARQVEQLEALAKRQMLAGDFAGAARSASRADDIRQAIPKLANFERPAR